jgi:hypothetical protein
LINEIKAFLGVSASAQCKRKTNHISLPAWQFRRFACDTSLGVAVLPPGQEAAPTQDQKDALREEFARIMRERFLAGKDEVGLHANNICPDPPGPVRTDYAAAANLWKLDGEVSPFSLACTPFANHQCTFACTKRFWRSALVARWLSYAVIQCDLMHLAGG